MYKYLNVVLYYCSSRRFISDTLLPMSCGSDIVKLSVYIYMICVVWHNIYRGSFLGVNTRYYTNFTTNWLIAIAQHKSQNCHRFWW